MRGRQRGYLVSVFSRRRRVISGRNHRVISLCITLQRQCTVLGDTCLVAWEVSLDILHKNIQTGRKGNKHAMVPTCQGVLMVAAAAAVAAADASVAADVARGAVKPTAAADDDTDGLCRRSLSRALPRPLRSRRAPPPRPWPPPRGLTPVARAWVPPVLPSLVLESSIRARASLSSPGSISVIIRNIFFSTPKTEGRPFRIRRLISFLAVLTLFCLSFITNAFALAT